MTGMDNRERLLQCALDLFADRGYDAVGVQEIVDTAGVTKPTMYHYFGSKHQLLQELLSGYFTRLDALLADAAHYSGDLPLTLKRITETCFAFARQYPAFYRLQLGLWFAPQSSEGYQVVSRLHQVQFDLIQNVFTQAVVQHGNMRGRHRAYTATFIGMIHTYIGLALNGYAELNQALVEQAVHQFQHGIYS